jgi:hypothetical protein
MAFAAAVAEGQFGAAENPSAQIVDCARMKSASARNRRSCIKSHAVPGFDHNRAFDTDVLFIRIESTVGARSAQLLSRHVGMFETRY